LPFAAIARIAAPDEVQSGALEALRETAMHATERFGRSEPTAEHPPLAANAQAVAGAVIRSFTAAVEPYECLYLVV
jgi:hypothetical protein